MPPSTVAAANVRATIARILCLFTVELLPRGLSLVGSVSAAMIARMGKRRGGSDGKPSKSSIGHATVTDDAIVIVSCPRFAEFARFCSLASLGLRDAGQPERFPRHLPGVDFGSPRY